MQLYNFSSLSSCFASPVFLLKIVMGNEIWNIHCMQSITACQGILAVTSQVTLDTLHAVYWNTHFLFRGTVAVSALAPFRSAAPGRRPAARRLFGVPLQSAPGMSRIGNPPPQLGTRRARHRAA